ncbi:MAG: protein kinase [Anaerolineae bacterium]|nr:protein kinase [Anaerolineae bacterium]
MTLPEDTILENRYRIDRLLAHGGMGAIYRGFDTNLQMAVAIKENFFQTPQAIRQFEQEALILARLHHPSLPRVIHHFSFDGQQYLVMDYIEGEDLWTVVKTQGHPLAETQAIKYIIQVADAVSYLHHQNPPIIHRDIKPQNIKITPDNRAVLVDFGIAKIAEHDMRTRTGAQAVTPGFSPPEQYSGLGTTPASDIYSLGATLYAILTGKKPPDSITLMVSQAKFEPPKMVNAALSEQISQTITHAMRPQADERPQSMATWQQALQAALESSNLATADDSETMLSGTVLASEEGQDLVVSPNPTTHWLVDSKGRGYPLDSEPLVIGRHSNADIVLTVLSASRQHALVRLENGRCLVMDNNSANGTFINEQRLGETWHPLSPGDVLAVGSARFQVTTSPPAQIAPVKSKLAPTPNDKVETMLTPMANVEAAVGTASPGAVSSMPAAAPQPLVDSTMTGSPAKLSPAPSPPTMSSPVTAYPASTKKRSRGIILPIIIAAIVLLAAVGAAAYFIFSASNISTSATATVVAQNVMIAEQTQTAEAELEIALTITAEAELEETVGAKAEETARAESEAARQAKTTATAKSLAAKTATAANVSTNTPTSTPTQQMLNRLDKTDNEPTSTPTAPPKTPTAPLRPVTAGGPTAIPVETVESVAEIGNAPVTAVEINPQNPKEVYILVKGDVNSIYKSNNGGDGPWGKLDIDASGLTNLVIDATNPVCLYAPAWNAVLKSVDGGNNWEAYGQGLSTANRVVDVVAIDPVNPKVLYGGIGSTLIVSTDGGASWASDGYGNGLGQGRITSIAVDPFNHDVVFVGGEFGSIYKSIDSGRAFIQLAFNTGKGAYSIAVNPKTKDEYLVGINSYDAAIMKTTNAGDFQSVSNGLIFGGADSAYCAITYSPSNPNIVYAGSGYEHDGDAKGIFKSTDGGQNWESVNNGLRINPATGYPHYIRSIAVHPTDPNIVFAATGWGLYKSSDGGANWSLK